MIPTMICWTLTSYSEIPATICNRCIPRTLDSKVKQAVQMQQAPVVSDVTSPVVNNNNVDVEMFTTLSSDVKDIVKPPISPVPQMQTPVESAPQVTPVFTPLEVKVEPMLEDQPMQQTPSPAPSQISPAHLSLSAHQEAQRKSSRSPGTSRCPTAPVAEIATALPSAAATSRSRTTTGRSATTTG